MKKISVGVCEPKKLKYIEKDIFVFLKKTDYLYSSYTIFFEFSDDAA